MGIKHLLKDRGYGIWQTVTYKTNKFPIILNLPPIHPLFTNEIWNLSKFTMVKIHTFVLLLL